MTSNRLLVVCDLTSFDDVAALVGGGSTFAVARCSSPAQLLLTVATARLDHFQGDVIDILDIHDHSVNNGMQLGSKQEVLFDVVDGRLYGTDLAIALGNHLRDTAHVRLLGCDVAFESDAAPPTADADVRDLLARHLDRRFLLVALADALGQRRIVFGTNCVIDYYSFTSEGLGRSIEQLGLFSSLAAVHADPCAFGAQGELLRHLRSHERPLEPAQTAQRAASRTQRNPME